jgi:hypothetical protein
MPMRGELPKAIARPYPRSVPERQLSRVLAAIADPEVQLLVAIGLMGALITLDVARLFPDFGMILMQLEPVS